MLSLALRCLVSLLLLGSGVAVAQSTDATDAADAQLAQEDRIAELERTVKVLADELERTRADVTVPEEEALESQFGLGPAASKVFAAARGLSLGGYSEGYYKAFVNDSNGEKNRTDLLRAVLYAGYKFNENIVFNSEIEFEHATTEETVSSGPGAVSVEFATLDYFWRPWANARAGLLLIPMGFINQIHEPPYYLGVNRPEVERRLIPATWSENGTGVFGEIAEQIEYAFYVTNGLNAKGYQASGIRDGRQKGNEALAEDPAFTGRVDWTPLPGLLVGASTFVGKAGQDQDFEVTGVPNPVNLPSTLTALWDIHAQYDWRGLHLRGLFTMTHIDDAGQLTMALRPEDQGGIGEIGDDEVIAKGLLGGYAEVSYDVLQWITPDSDRTLEPFFRFEYLDTQFNVPSGFTADDSNQLKIYTVGLQFKPIPNVVLKADYRNKVAGSGSAPDEFNVGFGLAF
jgi:opacity protein-like surface antigen